MGDSSGAGFVSPLAITDPGQLPWIDFGRPPPLPAIEVLADRLDRAIVDLTAGLPAPLRDEALAVLRAYAGGRRFVDLYYRPVWSFLHWLPSPEDGLLEIACRTQATSLFLHLWDDHLSDGQLAPDLVRLHLRSLAWQSFISGAGLLGRAAGLPSDAVGGLVDAYLTAVHRPGLVTTLDAHAERMVAQVGIWRAVPKAFGALAGGAAGSAALVRVVERFSVAWRLMDDVQDAAADVRGTQQNALALALDGPGRAAWADCAMRSAGQPRPDPDSWAAVLQAVDRGGLARVLDRVAADLDDARQTASAMGWHGLADELHASQPRRNEVPEG